MPGTMDSTLVLRLRVRRVPASVAQTWPASRTSSGGGVKLLVDHTLTFVLVSSTRNKKNGLMLMAFISCTTVLSHATNAWSIVPGLAGWAGLLVCSKRCMLTHGCVGLSCSCYNYGASNEISVTSKSGATAVTKLRTLGRISHETA